MILNTIILSALTILVLFLSDLYYKKIGRKIFPLYYDKIDRIDKRLSELRNLIRLTMIHNDKKSFEKLQKEYSELYNKILFTKISVNSIFLLPLIIFSILINIFLKHWELWLPPVNLIIFILGIYFLVKYLIAIIKSFYTK
jgi:hypothetical protein